MILNRDTGAWLWASIFYTNLLHGIFCKRTCNGLTALRFFSTVNPGKLPCLTEAGPLFTPLAEVKTGRAPCFINNTLKTIAVKHTAFFIASGPPHKQFQISTTCRSRFFSISYLAGHLRYRFSFFTFSQCDPFFRANHASRFAAGGLG